MPPRHTTAYTPTIPENAKALSIGHRENSQPLLVFNRHIQREASPEVLNESYLERLLDQFKALPGTSNAIGALTLARINELALLCAGNYADSCEYAAAGDLLANPARVAVYVRDTAHPVAKERHKTLSTQFSDAVPAGISPIQWFMKNTIVEIRKKPILMELDTLLKHSGLMSDFYIGAVRKRMEKIVDTMGFFFSWQIASAEAFREKLRTARPAEAAFIQNALCGFDRGLFDEMGEDICRLLKDVRYRSRFIVRPGRGASFLRSSQSPDRRQSRCDDADDNRAQ